MAKMTLVAGIESISGTVCESNGSVFYCKTFTRPDGKKESRLYMKRKKSQCKHKPSPAELQNRVVFTQMTQRFNNLPKEELKKYTQLFRSKKGKLNGKQYRTLRGFTIAIWYAERAEEGEKGGLTR